MSALLDSLLTPQQKAQADRIDAAMVQLSGLLAERAVLNTAGQALDASRRAAFEAITNNTQAQPSFDRAAGVYPGLCGDLRAEVDAEGGFTSLQPLGDAQVMVVYSSDGTDLSIDGIMLGGDFVHIDCFTSVVRGQWYRAIRAEERKDAEIASWAE
jgi:hypothetical protein